MSKFNKYERAKWTIALNLLSIGLIATISSDFLSRLSKLKHFDSAQGVLILDWGSLVVWFVILWAALVVAFSSTNKQIKQVKWIFKSCLPYLVGIIFYVSYLFIIIYGSESFMNNNRVMLDL